MNSQDRAVRLATGITIRWWQVDLSWLTIRRLGAAGLVWDIRTPEAGKLAAKTAK